jgi:hypothetical protein
MTNSFLQVHVHIHRPWKSKTLNIFFSVLYLPKMSKVLSHETFQFISLFIITFQLGANSFRLFVYN